MEINKPIRLLLTLFLGFFVLAGLAYISALFVFVPASSANLVDSKGETSTVSPGYAQDSDGRPEDMGGKDIMPVPSYYSNSGVGDGSKIIKNASLAITVKDFDGTVDSLKTAVNDVKGFVQTLTDSGVSNDRTVTITVRVPAEKYDEILTKIKGYGVTVEKVNEGSDDVSAVYKDLQARLKNQKALEKQLLVLLDKATKVDDILAVQTQLSYVREQIEVYESQIKMYDTQVNMSGISVTMTKASEALDVTGDNWKPLGVLFEAFTALVAFGKGLIAVGIWIIVFSPLVLIPAAMVWYAMKKKK